MPADQLQAGRLSHKLKSHATPLPLIREADDPARSLVAPFAAVAGYSGTPLPKKLGIKPGARVAVLSAPDGFLDTTLARCPTRSRCAPARAARWT